MHIGIPRDIYLKVRRVKKLMQEIRYNTKIFDHFKRMERSNKEKQKAQVKNKYQKGNWIKKSNRGFPGGSVVKNLTANAGHMGVITDPGRSHA